MHEIINKFHYKKKKAKLYYKNTGKKIAKLNSGNFTPWKKIFHRKKGSI